MSDFKKTLIDVLFMFILYIYDLRFVAHYNLCCSLDNQFIVQYLYRYERIIIVQIV